MQEIVEGIKATAQSQCTHLELDELARDLIRQRVTPGLSLTVDSVVGELCATETKDLFDEPSLGWANPAWTGKYTYFTLHSMRLRVIRILRKMGLNLLAGRTPTDPRTQSSNA